MSQKYYYRLGENQYGPVSSSELISLAASGTLRADSLIRLAEQQRWYLANKVRGLFPIATMPTEEAKTYVNTAPIHQNELPATSNEAPPLPNVSWEDVVPRVMIYASLLFMGLLVLIIQSMNLMNSTPRSGHNGYGIPITSEDLSRGSYSRYETSAGGSINWSMVSKARTSWQNGNFSKADRSEQAAALMVILLGIEKQISDPDDREATLDYIQSSIDSW